MKQYCVICLNHPLKNTIEHYQQFGNVCSPCNGRIEKVMKHQMSREECDEIVMKLKKKNLKRLQLLGDTGVQFDINSKYVQ